MDLGERGVERAEAFQLKQSEQAIARIRGQLDQAGETSCQDCGDEIEEARRAALPSAVRCISCQTTFERLKRLGRAA